MWQKKKCINKKARVDHLRLRNILKKLLKKDIYTII